MRNIIITLSLGILRFLSAQTTVWTQTAHVDGNQVNGVAFLANGTKIMSGTECHPSVIRHYNTTNGNITFDYALSNNLMCLMGVGFSGNSNHFAVVEEMGNILVFDNTLTTPVITSTISMGTSYAFSMDFSPNSQKLIAGGSNGKMQAYRLSNSSLVFNVNAHSSWVTAVNCSPNNMRIASGGSDDLVKIWDTTGTLLHNCIGHTGDVTSVKFTKDNSKLISASIDDRVRIWDVNNGALLQTITPTAGDIFGVDVSPDNNYFATVSNDKLIRIYSTSTYSLIASFGVTSQGIPKCIAWSPSDVTKIAVGYSNGIVILYNYGTTTRVNEIGNATPFSAFPNPCTDYLTISGLPLKTQKITLTDLYGQLIDQIPVKEGETEINISNLKINSGVYFINVFADGNIMTKKLLKVE
ncbi:MAG: T9SS type A sorting domain-containing protein [Bacteroidota bacterium]|jgi:WD40 repeat protein|nr:T9SS type A sorting domain-containing protein [Bacteroidota bacterium]MCA6442766.1 T9SS type A sorting domain-containing protein [Bacteroidota bacterium]